MAKIASTRVSTPKDVFRAFWSGIAPDRCMFAVTILTLPLANIASVIVPIFYKRFFDIVGTVGGDRSLLIPDLIHIVLIIFAINIFGWFCIRLGLVLLNVFESSVIARLKQQAFDYVMNHSHAFFSNTFAGSLVQRVNRFGRAFERLLDTLLFNLVPLLIHTIGAIVVVWHERPAIAAMIGAWIAGVIVLNYLFSQWKLKYDLAVAATDTKTTARLADAIGNHPTIVSFTGEAHESHTFKSATLDQARALRTSWNLGWVFDTIQAACIVLVEFAVFYYAVPLWREGAISVGVFVLLQVYIIGLAQRLWDFGRIIRNVYEGYADSKEMVDILIAPHEIVDTSNAKHLDITKGGAIQFSKASFGYSQNHMALSNLSCEIIPGQKIALIGHSGAGKSTIVKLLMRLHELTGGHIFIDGQDIRHVTQESLRQAISLVPQDPILFHRSLKENIRYGKRDASDDEVIAAAKLAHCDDFIQRLPQGYDTFVGERGIKLSGGERQRVAIARAILKNAPILILDEATSSLDSHSETLIQEAMDKLMEGKTVIAIAHRLSTIKKMDRIIVLDKGSIAEDGTHDELLANKGIYQELWNHQSGGYMVED